MEQLSRPHTNMWEHVEKQNEDSNRHERSQKEAYNFLGYHAYRRNDFYNQKDDEKSSNHSSFLFLLFGPPFVFTLFTTAAGYCVME